DQPSLWCARRREWPSARSLGAAREGAACPGAGVGGGAPLAGSAARAPARDSSAAGGAHDERRDPHSPDGWPGAGAPALSARKSNERAPPRAALNPFTAVARNRTATYQ